MEINKHVYGSRVVSVLLLGASILSIATAALGQDSLGEPIVESDPWLRFNASSTDAAILVTGAALTAAAFAIEDPDRAAETLDDFIEGGSDFGNAYGTMWGVWALTVGIGGAGYLTGKPALTGAAIDMGVSLLITSSIVGVLKVTINRERPDGGNYSFPSGHAAKTFAVAAVMDRHFGWKFGVPAYIAAVITGMGRMEDSRHYLSDVLTGATIGILVGRTFSTRQKHKDVELSVFPGGAMLSLAF